MAKLKFLFDLSVVASLVPEGRLNGNFQCIPLLAWSACFSYWDGSNRSTFRTDVVSGRISSNQTTCSSYLDLCACEKMRHADNFWSWGEKTFFETLKRDRTWQQMSLVPECRLYGNLQCTRKHERVWFKRTCRRNAKSLSCRYRTLRGRGVLAPKNISEFFSVKNLIIVLFELYKRTKAIDHRLR